MEEQEAISLGRRALATGMVAKQAGLLWIWTQERLTMTHRSTRAGKAFSDPFFNPVRGGWVLAGPDLRDSVTLGGVLLMAPWKEIQRHLSLDDDRDDLARGVVDALEGRAKTAPMEES